MNGCSGGSSGDPSSSTPPPAEEPVVAEYHPYDVPPIDEATKQSFLDSTNNARAAGQDCGTYGVFPPAPALLWSDALYKASYEHSVDMSVVGESSPDISHTGSGGASDWTAQILELGRGSEFYERAQNNGIQAEGISVMGENAHGYPPTIEIATADWIESDAHCANLMNASHTHLGLAVVENPNSQLTYYWTQLFGTKY